MTCIYCYRGNQHFYMNVKRGFRYLSLARLLRSVATACCAQYTSICVELLVFSARLIRSCEFEYG